MTCEAGGTCAFIGTGNTDKVVLHALGLRAAGGGPPDQGGGRRRGGRAPPRPSSTRCATGARSAAPPPSLRANLKNALRVWSAIGGSMNWALHFPYIAAYVGVRITPADDGPSLRRHALPHRHQPHPRQELLHPGRGEAGGRALRHGLDGEAPAGHRARWRTRPPSRARGRERLADARDPNDRILYKTRPAAHERDRRGRRATSRTARSSSARA